MPPDFSRCRCGTFLSVSLTGYVIVMIFMFGMHYQESVKVLKIKGRIARLGKANEEKHSSIGVNFLKNELKAGAGTDAKIQECRKNEEAPKKQAGVNVTKEQKPDPPVPPPREKLRKLIIMTYARTGSSFLAELLQQHPEGFYVYEPLFQMQRNYLDKLPFTFLNGRVENTMDPLEYWGPGSMCIRVIPQIGNCQFQLLDVATLTQDNMQVSESTKPFVKCLQRKLNVNKTNIVSVAESCLDTVTTPCEDARVVAVKVIRLTMDQLEQILLRDSDVKVIYLLRDPRGSLRSQGDKGRVNWKNVGGPARYQCGRMAEDLAYAKTVAKQFPKQILMVRYEEIAEHPQAAAEFMYNFLGLKMTDSIRKYIQKIASSPYSPNCDKCALRKNIKDTAYRWRDKMTFMDAKIIQEACSKMFDIMGYRRFHNKQELGNRNITLRFEEFGKGFMVMKPSALR